MTHWCHIYASLKWVSIGSDNGLSPNRRQAIARTNADLLLIGPLGTNFSEILIKIQNFSFTKMNLKISSAKWQPFSLGLSVLKMYPTHSKYNIRVSFRNSQYLITIMHFLYPQKSRFWLKCCHWRHRKLFWQWDLVTMPSSYFNHQVR